MKSAARTSPSGNSDLEHDGAGIVVAVSASASHSFAKQNRDVVHLVAGRGVEGDAHCGETVKHRSRVARDPSQPNLRQVHLIHAELFEQLGQQGFALRPGEMGENLTTRGIDLLGLPVGAQLHFSNGAAGAVVAITGLRNPCGQLNGIAPGLMQAVLPEDRAGNTVRIAGIMGVVLRGGSVRPGDAIRIALPQPPYAGLQSV